MLGVLYDIHGNLPALEAVLADAPPVDGWLLGGDYTLFGAWPVETLVRLRGLPRARWIRSPTSGRSCRTPRPTTTSCSPASTPSG